MQKKSRCLFITLIVAFAVALLGSTTFVSADKSGPSKGGDASLPMDLFLKTAPADAIGVGEARKTAEEGKLVVIRGRVGGAAKPIADKYAMFLMTDLSLALCKDGCADFCQMPREQLLANMATIQVVDNAGRPLKVSVEGMNGLKPLSEVVVKGMVAKRDNNFLVVNAKNIFVDGNAK